MKKRKIKAVANRAKPDCTFRFWRNCAKQKLRILVFSDLHGNEKALKAIAKKAMKADLLVCAGDFTVFENNILRIMRKLDSIGKPVMLVHGNHEDAVFVAEICKRLKNVKFVHRKVYGNNEFPNYVFIGHGGEGFDAVSGDFERFARTVIPKLQHLRKRGKKIVFITHKPPHNTKLDYIWARHGNKSYTRFVKKIQPMLHVCGHLHETQGKRDRIGKTLIINPGPKGEIVRI